MRNWLPSGSLMMFSLSKSLVSRRVIATLAGLVSLAALNASAQEQAFRGAIMDSTCAGPKGHTAMLKPGETMAECTLACVKAGATFVLYNPQTKMVYPLEDQVKPKAFAGHNVLVIGTLEPDHETLKVAEILSPLSPKVMQAKTVYIDCEQCVRGMTKASQAAIDALAEWKRFTVVQDPRRADLILLFSPNPYRGDYVTRKGPDTRPVHLLNTYLDVVDPHTGASYFSYSDETGSWRVGTATKDLIGRFRGRMEAEDGHVTRLLKLDAKPVSASSSDSGVVK